MTVTIENVFVYRRLEPQSSLVISNIVATPGLNDIVVTWTTNQPATSVLDYGTTTFYGTTLSDATLTTSHSLTIMGLDPSTAYQFRITSVDGDSNSASSANQSATTDAAAPQTPNVPTANAPTSVTADGMSISATTEANADGYQAEITIDGQAAQVTPVLATPLYEAPGDPLISNLPSDTDITIRWRAINSLAATPESAWSVAVIARTQATVGGPDPDDNPNLLVTDLGAQLTTDLDEPLTIDTP